MNTLNTFFRQSPRMRPPSPGAMKQRPPSPQTQSAKPPPIQKPAITPTGPPALRKRDSKSKDVCPVPAVASQSSDASKTKEKEGEPVSVDEDAAKRINALLLLLRSCCQLMALVFAHYNYLQPGCLHECTQTHCQFQQVVYLSSTS